MKRRDRYLQKWSWLIPLVFFAALVLALMATEARSATQYFPWVLPGYGGELDSVRFHIRQDTTLKDSVTGVNSFPTTEFIPYSDTSSVLITAYYYWNADTTAYPSYVDLPNVVPILEDDHGSGSWESAGVSGLYDVSILILNTADSTPLTGLPINIKNWALTTSIFNGTTNENGIMSFSTNFDTIAHKSVSPFYVFRKDSPTGAIEWDSVDYTANFTDTIWGTLSVPAAASAPNYVNAYIDVGSGFVDSLGNMIPRDKLKLTLKLIGASIFTDGTWAILPTDSTQTPDSVGRCSWQIPANSVLTPTWSKYELTWEARDGRSSRSGLLRRFIVDIIPDPINILETTEVY